MRMCFCVLQGRNLEDIPRYNEISDRVNLSCENVHAGIQLLETRTNRLFRKNLEIFPGNDAGVRCFIDFCYNRLPHVMNFPILSGKVFSKVWNNHNWKRHRKKDIINLKYLDLNASDFQATDEIIQDWLMFHVISSRVRARYNTYSPSLLVGGLINRRGRKST